MTVAFLNVCELKKQFAVVAKSLTSVSLPSLPPPGHISDVMLVLRKGILIKLSLCYSIVYHYNGAQRYKQFLQVSQLYQVLSLLGLALRGLPSRSVSSVFMVLYTPCPEKKVPLIFLL